MMGHSRVMDVNLAASRVCNSPARLTEESFEDFNSLSAFICNALAWKIADSKAGVVFIVQADPRSLVAQGKPVRWTSLAEAPNRLALTEIFEISTAK
jgi:hypothetical protein